MPWPIDEAKLNRVRALMKDQDLTALVVRAPDNLVYLTNYWCMKGYDVAIFPREGEPTLIALEPQLADAQRNSWTKDIRLFKSYHESDPRPPQYRALDLALKVLKERGLTDKVAVELNMGTQSADRMVGEPTTPTRCISTPSAKSRVEVVDATPLLNEARAIKTPQEIERMRLANELAALAMEYTREHMRPGMKESEVGGMYEGFVHGLGVGYKGKVEMARAFTLVWSGKGIATFTATGDRPIQKNEPTLVRDLGLRRRLLDRPDQECLPRRAYARISQAARSAAEAFSTKRSCYAHDGAELSGTRSPDSRSHCGRRISRPAVASHLSRRRRARA